MHFFFDHATFYQIHPPLLQLTTLCASVVVVLLLDAIGKCGLYVLFRFLG